MNNLINIDSIRAQAAGWREAKPFSHFVVDDFFTPEAAAALEREFPDISDRAWGEYKNAIEIKKVCNRWDAFPKVTYNVFRMLNSGEFVSFIRDALFADAIPIFSDPGLNGGGWHIHGQGGKLNTHLDYSLHPKLGLQRKLNIIVYLNSRWQPQWGGSLGLWGNESAEKPGELVTEIEAKYNRAAIFDTTQNSWHGLPHPLQCPDNEYRKSIAVYYLTDPPDDADERKKALFAPTKEQADDPEVLALIKQRATEGGAAAAYKKG